MAELPKDMIFHYHSDDGITVKVDAIPLVRCGECKHYNAGFECLVEGYGIERDPDWFCGDGKRKVQE